MGARFAGTTAHLSGINPGRAQFGHNGGKMGRWVQMEGNSVDEIRGGVDLAEAIEALRGALVQAMWDGQKSRVRFRVEPVELTVQVGVTRTGKGAAGVKWHILTMGGERSRQLESTQTLKIRLAPFLFDDTGTELTAAEQLVIDHAGHEASAPADRASHEPA
jgi:hypothetical protein